MASSGERMRHQETAETPKPELAVSQFVALCGQRGMWPMSSFDNQGNAQDVSGHGHWLTYNDNPVYDYDGQAPYIQLDGTGDFLERADEVDLDILGTETYVAAAVRGLTMGGWFWFDVAGNREAMISKWNDNGVNQRAYMLFKRNDEDLVFTVSSTGADFPLIQSAISATQTNWQFVVGRFDPSTELAIFVNGTKDTLVAGVPASLFNSNASLLIGASDLGADDNMDGRASMCFLCAAALSDETISFLYQQTRPMYRV